MSKQTETPETVDVIDVTIKSTLKIPLKRIVVTAITPNLLQHRDAPSEAEGNPPKTTFTLCELYQKGKCERKESCRLVHVDTEFLKEQREKHFDWMHLNSESFGQLPSDKVFEVFNATIKEVMEVPKSQLEYTRGLFLSPEDRDKKAASSTPSNAYCGKVPTACLLFLNGSCKWGEHCNQAHISRKWLHSKNREFQRWMEGCKVQFNALASNELISAYHPNLYEVIKVPKQFVVQFTRGLYQGGDKVPSICLLFQKHRCSCEELCKQIHVSSDWLAKQRKSGPPGRRQRKEVAQASSPPTDPGTPQATEPHANASFASHPLSVTSHSTRSPTDSPGCSSSASHRSVSPITCDNASPNAISTAAIPGPPLGAAPNAGVSRTLDLGNPPGDGDPKMAEAPKPATPFKLNAQARPFIVPQPSAHNASPAASASPLPVMVASPTYPMPQLFPYGFPPPSTGPHVPPGHIWVPGFTPAAFEHISVGHRQPASPLAVQTPPSSPAVHIVVAAAKPAPEPGASATGQTDVGPLGDRCNTPAQIATALGTMTSENPSQLTQKGNLLPTMQGFTMFDFGSELLNEMTAAVETGEGQEEVLPLGLSTRQKMQQGARASQTRSDPLDFASLLKADTISPETALQQVREQLQMMHNALRAHQQDVDTVCHQVSSVMSSLHSSKIQPSDIGQLMKAADALAVGVRKVRQVQEALHEATDSSLGLCQGIVGGNEEFDLMEAIISTCGRPGSE